MKKIVLLCSLVGALFANEIVAKNEAIKFIDALKNMNYEVVNAMLHNDHKNMLTSLDNHIIYFRDIKVNNVKQVDEFGHYLVTLDNQEFNQLELKRNSKGAYKIVGL